MNKKTVFLLQDTKELNEELYGSAFKAHAFTNILGPINAQLGNVSYVLCAMVGGLLVLGGKGIFAFSVGKLASFLTFNKSFNMPINQISQQFNSIVMALAGAERIFNLIDEPVDIVLGNHVHQNNTVEKGQQIREDYNPFIDCSEWKKFCYWRLL